MMMKTKRNSADRVRPTRSLLRVMFFCPKMVKLNLIFFWIGAWDFYDCGFCLDKVLHHALDPRPHGGSILRIHSQIDHIIVGDTFLRMLPSSKLAALLIVLFLLYST